MKHGTIKKIKHFVFENVGEFEGFFRSKGKPIPALVKDWREGHKRDWVIADDGGIVQILGEGEFRHHWRNEKYPGRRWVRTIVGTFIVEPHKEMDTDFTLHPDPYRLSENRGRKGNGATFNERILVANLLSGNMTPQEAYESAYSPKANWKDHFTSILKRKRVIEMLNAAAKEAAEKAGISLPFLFERFAMLLEETGNDNVKYKILEKLLDVLTDKQAVTNTSESHLHLHSPLKGVDLKAIENQRIEALESGD